MNRDIILWLKCHCQELQELADGFGYEAIKAQEELTFINSLTRDEQLTWAKEQFDLTKNLIA